MPFNPLSVPHRQKSIMLCVIIQTKGGNFVKSISQYISVTLSEVGIIQKNEVDICKYGIDYFIISVLEILSILVLSLFVGNFVNTLIYFIAFTPLRIYAGGYHADTKIRCYIILLAVYALFTIITDFFPNSYYMPIQFCSIILTIGVILKFSPVVQNHKNFNDIEIDFYKKVSIKIMMVESLIVSCGIFFIPHNKYILSFSLGELTVSLSMLAAVIKSKMTGGENYEKG